MIQLEDSKDWDLVVLGGGPTGLTAALTAADAGLNVAIIDGTPAGQVQFSGPTGLFSKALRDSAKRVNVRTLREMGMLDTAIFTQVKDLTRNIVNSSGSKNLAAVEDNRITHKRATAVLLPDEDSTRSTLAATDLETGETVTTSCRKLLIATGSSPFRLPNMPYDDLQVFDSDSIKKLTFLPKSMMIIGSGIIAIEYAKIFSTLETEVTVIIRAESIADPLARIGIDPDIAHALLSDLTSSGVKVITEAEVEVLAKPTDSAHPMIQVQLTHSKTGEKLGDPMETNVIMTATGRKANTGGLGLEEAGVKLGKGGVIDVDGDLKTSVPGVYAAGDCVGPPSLASTGIEQAQTAVRRMFDQDESLTGTWAPGQPGAGKDPLSLLACPLTYPVGIWTIPETSFIGYTADSAKKAGFKQVGEGVAEYKNTIRGRVQGIEQGLLKLVFSKPDGRILGVHIFGEDACELIHYGTALAQSEKTVRDVLGVTFTAVTFHELFVQAAQDAIKQLDQDSWRRILRQIGSPATKGDLEKGLIEAGMNELQAKEFVSECEGGVNDSVTLDEAMDVARRFRIPSKYRLIEALARSIVGSRDSLRQKAAKMYSLIDTASAGSVAVASVVAALVDKGLEVEEAAVTELCGGDWLCQSDFSQLYERLLFAESTTGFKLRARQLFEEMDADGSGSVDQAELIAFLAGRGIVFSESGEADLMRSVDRDGGGDLCFEEFYAVFENLFRYHRADEPASDAAGAAKKAAESKA